MTLPSSTRPSPLNAQHSAPLPYVAGLVRHRATGLVRLMAGGSAAVLHLVEGEVTLINGLPVTSASGAAQLQAWLEQAIVGCTFLPEVLPRRARPAFQRGFEAVFLAALRRSREGRRVESHLEPLRHRRLALRQPLEEVCHRFGLGPEERRDLASLEQIRHLSDFIAGDGEVAARRRRLVLALLLLGAVSVDGDTAPDLTRWYATSMRLPAMGSTPPPRSDDG